ncbi:MAG: dimethylarginine dimethylaminohydrolase [Proteobacteria bacterium]|nr:dimethylarginine dimethylaminohydrolase [Pseudomonadota bacterium]
MIFNFTKALVRAPGRSVVNGLSSQTGPRPSFETIAAEHARYIEALKSCGLGVEILPPLENYPDSIFVEDPALVFTGAAILLRPGAPSRQGEVKEIEGALRKRFARVLAIEEGFADGGDMLLTPAGMFIGLSSRTDQAGARQLGGLLRQLGMDSRVVKTPPGTLHLKTDCSLIAEDHVLCTAALAASDIFEGYRKLVVPESERAAANALRLNDTLLVGGRFPETIRLLKGAGYKVEPVPNEGVGRIDAGLSCMSLRWN